MTGFVPHEMFMRAEVEYRQEAMRQWFSGLRAARWRRPGRGPLALPVVKPARAARPAVVRRPALG